MTRRKDLMTQVTDLLGARRVVWVGLRGDDIEPLSDLPQLTASFSLVGRYDGKADVRGVAYEHLSGTRVDPEVWDIDNYPRDEATIEFRHALLHALASDCAVVPYRPSQFLSAVCFARRDRCQHFGTFAAMQSAFEHKPWVESAVADLGLPHIPWTYVADEEQLTSRSLLAHGAAMLRRSRTSGGEGFYRVTDQAELLAKWPRVDEAFVSVAPFVEGGLPVNIGGTVWRDGVTVHHPSVQLIGIADCVTREFGYCGNDFGAARDLDPRIIDDIEVTTRRIGQWLRGYGYVGSFGVDFLVVDERALFMEVNPRFQGSTPLSCRLAIEAGQPDLMLEHLAAWLGLPCPESTPLRDLVAGTRDAAQLVVHFTGPSERLLDTRALVRGIHRSAQHPRWDSVLPPDVRIAPGAAVGRVAVHQRLTRTGFDLDPGIHDVVRRWLAGAGVGGATPTMNGEE